MSNELLAVPDSLTAEQCPLLKRFPDRLNPILAVYRTAVELAGQLRREAPDLYSRPEVHEILAVLQDIRGRLMRRRFQVGFLGPFQCGKSTTINNLLGEKVSGVGNAKACTSVVTRFQIEPPGSARSLTLWYFSTSEYLRRRNTLCDWARLPNVEGKSEEQILDALRTHNPHRAGGTGQREVLRDDIPFLRSFLASYLKYRSQDLIRAEARDKPADFNKLVDYTTHEPTDTDADPLAPPATSEYLMLSQVVCTLPNGQVDPELELVDCPGLGANRSVDTLLTKDYVQHLDAALVFLRAGAIYSTEANEILNALSQQFGTSLPERVWVIVNQMDTPERDAKTTGIKGKTTFDVIAELESQYKIPLTQVLLGCNGIFAEAKKTNGVADRKKALNKLQLEPEDDELVQKALAKYPALSTAYEQLLIDGSVGQLGRLMRQTVAPSVANSILQAVNHRLQQAVQDLTYWLAKARTVVSESEQRAARDWDNLLIEVAAELSAYLDGERGKLFEKTEQLGRTARTKLDESLGATLPHARVQGQLSTKDILERYRHDAEMLQKSVDEQFGQIVTSLYAETTTLLEKQNLPAVTLDRDRGPLEYWNDYRQEDRDVGSPWRRQAVPVMYQPELMKQLGDDQLGDPFHFGMYRDLLHHRLGTVAHHLALVARSRLRWRLSRLRKQVIRKITTAPRLAQTE